MQTLVGPARGSLPPPHPASSSSYDDNLASADSSRSTANRRLRPTSRRRLSNATNNITVLISSGDLPEAASRQASDPHPSVRPSICPACPAFRPARVVGRPGIVEAVASSLRGGTALSLHRRDAAASPPRRH